MSEPVTVICTYRVKPGEEAAFRALLETHWPTLRKFELATDAPTTIYRGEDKSGAPYFVEIFTWASEQAARTAHETPDVMAVWEPMGALTEDRLERPGMEFWHVQPAGIELANLSG